MRQGRPDEAEPWVQQTERVVQAETQPVPGAIVRYVRGVLELERNRDVEALAAFEAAELLALRVSTTHYSLPRTRALLVHALVRLGETERAGRMLASLSQQDSDHGKIRIAAAELLLAQDDPRAALGALAPVIDRPTPFYWQVWLAHAFVLAAKAQDALGDQAAAGNALERALDMAEPFGVMVPFLLYPTPVLLEQLAGHRTAHGALIAEIRSLLSGTRPPAGTGPGPLLEPLSDSEVRVLRYLPTSLTAPEIARDLYVSHNTVKTHVRNLYMKLGTNRRAEAVSRARDLGLLAPSGAARTNPPKPAAS